MRRTASILFSILISVCIPALISCDDDKDNVETAFSGFMTGYTDSNGNTTLLKDDFGTIYKVNRRVDDFDYPNSFYRAVASITLQNDSSARIKQIVQTLSYIDIKKKKDEAWIVLVQPSLSYKAPLDSAIPDSMRIKDPVHIESIYIGGGYVNIHLNVKVAKEGTQHNLFYARSNRTDRLEFKIYHNAYGDKPVYTKHAYISIPLSGYSLSKNDTVFLSCKGYEEDYEYKLVYK